MNIFYIKDYIIKNSTGEIQRFYLDKNNRINYDLYNNNCVLTDQYLISDDIINDFSLDIDSKDRVHLIYLTNEGSVYYNLYSNKKWAKKAITQFDIRSNSYSSLALRVNKENIHILYSFSNLINSKVWTIQHLIGVKGIWEKTNVISFTSGKTIPTYSFDFDKFDNIHMIYTSIVENAQQIYYTFFNSYLKKWNQVPRLLSEYQDSSGYPYILVDKADNIHAIWTVHKNNSSEVKYKHLPQLGSSKNTWKEEYFPFLNNEYKYPMIYEEIDCLKIFLIGNNKIFSLVSYDYGFSWGLNNTLSIPEEAKIQIARYLTNFPGEKNIKEVSQVLFCLDGKKILLKQNLIDYLSKFSFIDEKKNKNINFEATESTNTKEFIDEEDSILSYKEKNAEHQKKYFSELIDITLITDTLSDISDNMRSLDDVNKDYIYQFKNIDNTLLALKESIDINNQCLVEINKKIDELSNRTLRKRFWSRLFKRA
ncbi:hypothetical protein [Proteiniborus sp. MB09-C3]|uniref:hypothetical protein n=1 Tax=Proteiniborus sp. MB09-C3 TaxID=3050072 RepID=UPI0025567F89|nr:hypothetical protein [Proteiniborus sp. MB09-C3]WIV11197.1 hypothetical protein QO263_13700 [Proteiniborus sp. MB09-C3]